MEQEYYGQWIEGLEQDVNEYDKVFLIFGNDNWDTHKFCNLLLSQDKKKVLVLSTADMADEGASLSVYRQITKKEAYQLYQLYHMYEFSDRFFILSRETNYGGLFDFIDTGLLNLEEVLSAVLW